MHSGGTSALVFGIFPILGGFQCLLFVLDLQWLISLDIVKRLKLFRGSTLLLAVLSALWIDFFEFRTYGHRACP